MTNFEPDTLLVSEVRPSPNFGERVGHLAPDMILLHYTGMPDANLALERLCTPGSGVSCHYVVFEDGRIVQCVPESLRAWHAGESSWAGETDVNSCSIGIEIANPGHDHGYPDYPLRQIAAVTTLCRSIMKRRNIRSDRILAHSDVAPSRKQDPGEKFPWRLLAQSGVGHIAPAAPIMDGPGFEPGDTGDPIVRLQSALANYGYLVPRDGRYDDQTRDAVVAFQRHFRPEKVDGVVDSSTLIMLRALLETRIAPSVLRRDEISLAPRYSPTPIAEPARPNIEPDYSLPEPDDQRT